MEVKIDLTKVSESQLSINEYIYLSLLCEGKNTDKVPLTMEELEDLYQRKYIIDKEPTKKAMDLLELDIDGFEEFWKMYPAMVIRPGGNKDYLRVDKITCKKEYDRILREDKNAHEKIIKSLEYEIAQKTGRQEMSYFIRPQRWLRERIWEAMDTKRGGY
jgi:hypothetical protein